MSSSPPELARQCKPVRTQDRTTDRSGCPPARCRIPRATRACNDGRVSPANTRFRPAFRPALPPRDPRGTADPAPRHRPRGDPGVGRVLRLDGRRARPRARPLRDAAACWSAPGRSRWACPRCAAPTTSTPSRRSASRGSPATRTMERQVRRLIRWNAAVMVSSANRKGLEVGGHIATYASAASLYEVGYNHFFRGKEHPGGGDQLYIQGHAAPGIYARAYLMKRLTAAAARPVPPGGPARTGPGPVVLPAPAPDAGLLGVPDGLDGPRGAQLDLPGPLQPLPPQPRHQGHQPAARLGVPRRRRDGRARVARRDPARGPRGARQPHLRHQLQPAAARRARDAATARSCRSSRPTSAAPAGTSSRSSGAASGTTCSPRTSTACWSTR